MMPKLGHDSDEIDAPALHKTVLWSDRSDVF